MNSAIGIDLGTTNCCVFAVEGTRATLIPSRDGAPTTPSVVAFTPAGDVLVGTPARRQAVTNPERTIFGAKRLMGRKVDDPDIQALKETCPFQIVAAHNRDAYVRIGDRDLSPQEISAKLLEHLKERAEEYLGEAVSQAVITVPAFFDERQRQATKDAARLAGLAVQRLVNEPTAAALAYGLDKRSSQRIAVFDLGGGTFDVSILEVYQGAFEVLANAGDNLLGGDDFDRRVIAMLIDDFLAKTGVDLRGDATAMQRLYEAARAAKHELSVVLRVDVELPFIASAGGQPLHLHYEGLTRNDLERLVSDELDSVAEPCAMALEDCGLGTDDIDEVILVGGQTRMPAVQEAVERLFRKAPRRDINPDEIVARGAALQASALAGALDDVVLFDVTPHSLGIKVRGGRFSPVIRRNSRVPCRAQKPFQPATAEQDYVDIEVYQGESELCADNTHLGRFTLAGLPAKTHVMVTFQLDADGLLAVTAREPKTSREAKIDVVPYSGLDAADIQRILAANRPRRDEAEPPTQPSPGQAEATPELDQPAARGETAPPEGSEEAVAEAIDHIVADTIEGRIDPLVGSVLDGRYAVEKLLGEGGMGRVYLARHEVLGRPFAIKVMHSDLAINDSLAERFVMEARAAASIESAHVVDISDFGRLKSGAGYFVMEYLEGVTLKDLLEAEGTLPAAVIATVGRQIAEGLAAAHGKNIIHRDLKPDNVTLIEQKSSPYFVKILDFGIARHNHDGDKNKRLTDAGTMVGTPLYMAPEQMEGRDVDARSDIYALGVVMYEMATGRPPFAADTVVGLLAQHKYAAPVPIRERVTGQGCPPELESVILKCLGKKPADRYQSAAEVVDALAAIEL